jgi:signal transduction histidine kinase
MTTAMTEPGVRPTEKPPRGDGRPSLQPLVVALFLGLGYMTLCSVYILLSGKLAGEISTSLAELQRIEMFKGVAFVLVTGLVYFGFAYILLRRIAVQQEVLLQHQSALAESEGRAMAGTFASSLAHDMNNLLTIAQGFWERIRDLVLASPHMESARSMDRVLEDLALLGQRMSAIARTAQAGEVEQLDLTKLVQSVMTLAPSHRRVRKARLTTRLTGPLHLAGNRILIGRMLMNIVLNAAESAGEGGKVDVRLRREQGDAVIEVHDNGPGVPPEEREKIFEPFFSTKEGGTGLGLLAARLGAEEHGGTIEVGESDLGGAMFRVRLPLKTAEVKKTA